jgi:hypothetical protein
LDVKTETSKAVRNLGPLDLFDVVIFQDQKASLFMKSLVRPTPDGIRRLDAYLEDITTTGGAGTIEGFRLALSLRPTQIWLASDGDFEGPEVVGAIRRLNSAHVPINTVLSMAKGEDVPAHNLWQLAHDSGGVCIGEDGKPAPEPQPRPKVVRKAPTSRPAPKAGPSIFD